jgi:hypothetical protein
MKFELYLIVTDILNLNKKYSSKFSKNSSQKNAKQDEQSVINEQHVFHAP